MKKYIFLGLLMAPGMSLSQEATQKQLSLTWGAGNIIRQDLIFSPMIHRDFSVTHFIVGYERKKQMVHTIEVSFSSFNPTLSEGNYFEHGEEKNIHPHTLSFVSIYYALGKQIAGNEKFEIVAGGLFNPDIEVLNYAYGRTGPYFGYFASFGLGVFGNIRYQLNRINRFEAELKLPLVAWVARSPYLVNDDEFIENTASHNTFNTFFAFVEDGKPVLWNKWQQAGLTVQYHRRLANKVSAGAGYRFYMLHHVEPRNLLSFENYFTIHVRYQF